MEKRRGRIAGTGRTRRKKSDNGYKKDDKNNNNDEDNKNDGGGARWGNIGGADNPLGFYDNFVKNRLFVRIKRLERPFQNVYDINR